MVDMCNFFQFIVMQRVNWVSFFHQINLNHLSAKDIKHPLEDCFEFKLVNRSIKGVVTVIVIWPR